MVILSKFEITDKSIASDAKEDTISSSTFHTVTIQTLLHSGISFTRARLHLAQNLETRSQEKK